MFGTKSKARMMTGLLLDYLVRVYTRQGYVSRGSRSFSGNVAARLQDWDGNYDSFDSFHSEFVKTRYCSWPMHCNDPSRVRNEKNIIFKSLIDL